MNFLFCRKIKDPLKPKQPISAYLIYANERRAALKGENKSVIEVSKELGVVFSQCHLKLLKLRCVLMMNDDYRSLRWLEKSGRTCRKKKRLLMIRSSSSILIIDIDVSRSEV